MSVIQRFKNHFRSAFREFFVYHNSSLEFRAKLFALVVGANEHMNEAEEKIIYEKALEIYNNDENRAMSLLLAAKEYVTKIKDNNCLGVNELAIDISKLLKRNKRFVHKIDISMLLPFMEIQEDPDTKDYQRHIIDFLATLKEEYSIKSS